METDKAPVRCMECPYCRKAIYGHCTKKDVWFSVTDNIWDAETVPEWCPLKQKKDTEN